MHCTACSPLCHMVAWVCGMPVEVDDFRRPLRHCFPPVSSQRAHGEGPLKVSGPRRDIRYGVAVPLVATLRLPAGVSLSLQPHSHGVWRGAALLSTLLEPFGACSAQRHGQLPSVDGQAVFIVCFCAQARRRLHNRATTEGATMLASGLTAVQCTLFSTSLLIRRAVPPLLYIRADRVAYS